MVLDFPSQRSPIFSSWDAFSPSPGPASEISARKIFSASKELLTRLAAPYYESENIWREEHYV